MTTPRINTMQTEAVIEQAEDKSFWNTDPAIAKGAVVGALGTVLMLLVSFGVITEDQRQTIVHSVGEITFYLFLILPLVYSLVQATWTRLSVYSPRTAAKIALVNATAPAGTPPTLMPPP